jgi:PAS domain S-box-containing protein
MKKTSSTNISEFLFKKTNEATFILDPNGKITQINPAAEKLFQIKQEKAKGQSLRKIIPVSILEQTLSELRRKPRSCSKTRIINQPIDNSHGETTLEATIVPQRNQRRLTGFFVLTRDVTKEQKTQRTLRENQHLYNFVVENAPWAMYAVTAEGTVTWLNSTFERLSGWKRSEWLGKNFRSIIHPDDLPLAIKTLKQTLRGKKVLTYQLRVRSKSGEYLNGEFKTEPMVENGKIIGEIGMARDLTEKEKTEEALQFSKSRLQALFENVPHGVYQSSPEGRIIAANPALIRMLGYNSSKEFLKIDIARDVYVNAKDRKIRQKKLEKEGTLRNVEVVLRRKDGKQLVILENSDVVRDSHGKVLYYEGTLTDITDRKLVEDRLSALNFHAGKLNAARDSEQVYEFTLDAMEQILGFEYAIFLVNEKNSLRVASHRGLLKGFLKELPLDGSKRGITVEAANHRKPMLVQDVQQCADYVKGACGIMSELAVPIETEDKVFGVLDVQSRMAGRFSEKDVVLLQVLAAHAATAISNLERRQEIEKRSAQFASLMETSAEMIRSTDMVQRLQKVAQAIVDYGWRRVVIRAVRNEDMEVRKPEDIVTAGLTEEERQFLWDNRQPGQVWLERFGSEYERFKVGVFYHLPWTDPWVRSKFDKGTVASKLKQEEMVDWDPEDLLYAPLRLADGRIVGVLSVDDPVDGRRPTIESLAPLELFIYQAAVAIENSMLFEQLTEARNRIREYADELELKVAQRTRDLRKSEEKIRSIFVSSPSAIVVTDLKGKITECNDAAVVLHGCASKDELIGRNGFDWIARKDRKTALENLKVALQSGPVTNVTYTLLTVSGREFPGEFSISVIRDAEKQPVGFASIVNDVTARIRAEEALRDSQERLLKSERLAAIGEVAAMVGHDLRNPLTGIAGANYYLRLKWGSKLDERCREMLDVIEKDVEYSNKIVSDLLDYSREIRLELKETNVQAVLQDALSFVTVPPNVRLQRNVSDGLTISVDVERMRRIFVNLIKNALDAMPKGGTLTVCSGRKGECVKITFTDTGSGMSKETLKKVWSPLFTTKAKGMGFGLAICKRIVEAHGGSITVESRISKGTEFKLLMPIKPKVADGGGKVWVNVPQSLLSTMMMT